MNASELPTDMHRVYEDCDPVYLRQLREAAGLAVTSLARTACLSVAQVRHLEGDGEGQFYSPSIKRQAYKRLLMILGAEPPMARAEEAIQAAQHGLDKESHDTVNRIVALAEHTQALPSTSSEPRSWLTWLANVSLGPKALAWMATLAALLGGVYLARELAPEPLTWQSATSLFNPAPSPVAAKEMPAEHAQEPTSLAQAQDSVVAAVPLAPPVSQVSPIQAIASASLPAAAPLAKSNTLACAFSADALPDLSVERASKAGNYVYVVSELAMTVCVVDGAQQATLLELKPSEGRTVSGKSPWQIAGTQLSQAQIYFQGRRLALPEGKPLRVNLVETPLAR